MHLKRHKSRICHKKHKRIQSDGQVAWQWAYSAFGEEKPTIAKTRFANPDLNQSFGMTGVPAVTFNLRYPGQYFDQESGLHYNYHRSYSAATGRYTQADPIGLDGGWNRFGYAEQNPLSHSDKDGLKADPKNPLDLEKICKSMSIPFNLEDKPCKDSDECFEKAKKGLLSCNTSYWSPFSTANKIACIECWKHFQAQCPGL